MKHNQFKYILLLLLVATFIPTAKAQDVDGNRKIGFALRTNAVYWAIGSPSVGGDIRWGKYWQAGIDGSYGSWNIKNTAQHALRLSTVGAEVRRYFSNYDTPISNIYLGVDVRYRLTNRKQRAIGTNARSITTGVVVGYTFKLEPKGHWMLDLSVGAGYIHSNIEEYKWYPPVDNYRSLGSSKKNSFGVTNAAVNVVYRF